jgi:peptide/nickel transport system substrate-binding protein
MELIVTNEFPETVTSGRSCRTSSKEIGVDVEVRTLDFAAWLDAQGKGDFDAFMLGWLGNIDPDDFYYAQHHSTGTNNFQKYANPEVDEALDAARPRPTRTRAGAVRHRREADRRRRQLRLPLQPEVVQAWTDEVQGYEVRADRAIRFRDVSLSS